LLCSNSLPRKNNPANKQPPYSRPRSMWLLAVPYSENGPQADMFWNHRG
jgi:hypothetical protein